METRFGDNVLIEKAAPGHSAGAMDVSRYRSQSERITILPLHRSQSAASPRVVPHLNL
jgi:hypothetical protein